MKTTFKNKLQKIAVSAIFTCTICVMSQLSVLTPSGIPLSLQVLAIATCGYTLGAKWGTSAVLTYIILGTVGLPVFTGFRGGPQILFETSGGFIFGFLVLSLFCGLFSKSHLTLKLLGGILGVALCHLWGIIQLALISGISFKTAFLVGSLPFILKDLLCIVAAIFISKYINRILDKI